MKLQFLKRFFLSSVFAFLGIAFAFNVALADTFVVNNTQDFGDANPGDGFCESFQGTDMCTLRAAIEEANATLGEDHIEFNILGQGPHVFYPQFPYPFLGGGFILEEGVAENGNNVIIDGFTQPGASPNTIIEGSIDAVMQIVIDGSDMEFIDDVILGPSIFITNGDHNRIHGLVINNGPGCAITLDSSHNIIGGNFIGTDVTGTIAEPNYGHGICVYDPFNIIGVYDGFINVGIDGSAGPGNGNGVDPFFEGGRNLISGNSGSGIYLDDTDGNDILGNFIGTDITGLLALPNGVNGVHLHDTSHENIGTNFNDTRDDEKWNLISGNALDGIFIHDSNQNEVINNRIGTTWDGLAAIPNGRHGVNLQNDSNDNYIGMLPMGDMNLWEGNLISGNLANGINIADSDYNYITSNLIGTDITGFVDLGNNANGVYIYDNADYNLVGFYPWFLFTGQGVTDNGWEDLFWGNVISGNDANGVKIEHAQYNVVTSNFIGLAVDGITPLGNTENGVLLFETRYNLVGFSEILWQMFMNSINSGSTGSVFADNGQVPYIYNMISGNDMNGIMGVNADENVMSGNVVGVGIDGITLVPNLWNGIHLVDDCEDNVIGGSAEIIMDGIGSGDGISSNDINEMYEVNVIGGNAGNGILIEDSDDNYMERNYIGVNPFVGEENGVDAINPQEGPTVYREGLPISNSLAGIRIVNSERNMIGYSDIIDNNGDASENISQPIFEDFLSEYNIIAHNLGNGIELETVEFNGGGSIDNGNWPTRNNMISENSIYGNGGIGIDLAADGVSLNDDGDMDMGENGLLNYPVIEVASPVHARGYVELPDFVRDEGVDRTGLDTFARVEVYVSDKDPSGHGEGKRLLGTDVIRPWKLNWVVFYGDGFGSTEGSNGEVDQFGQFEVQPGDKITAVFVNWVGNTSEFSENATVILPRQATGLLIDGKTNPQFLTTHNPSFTAITNSPVPWQDAEAIFLQVSTDFGFDEPSIIWEYENELLNECDPGTYCDPVVYAGPTLQNNKTYFVRIRYNLVDWGWAPWSSGFDNFRLQQASTMLPGEGGQSPHGSQYGPPVGQEILPDGCSIARPFMCPNGECVEWPGQCPQVSCPPSIPFLCTDGSCVATEGECPDPGCTLDNPILCADGTCVADINICPEPPAICPPELPYLCPNGTCVSNMNACMIIPICEAPTPFMCPDGTCSTSFSQCAPPPPVCPVDSPVRCPDGSCMQTVELCLEGQLPTEPVCPVDMPVLCPDGSCAVSPDACAPLACPVNMPVLCPNEECVTYWNDCCSMEHEAMLLKGPDNRIFLIKSCQKHYITSMEVLGYFANHNITLVSDAVLNMYAFADPLTLANIDTIPYTNGKLIRSVDDNKIYYIENGAKRHVSTLESLLPFAGQIVYAVPPQAVANYSTGAAL